MRAGTDTLISIRPLAAGDRDDIHALLNATKVFSEEEVGTALELVDAVLADPSHPDYDVATAVTPEGEVAGFYCIGATPHTAATWDLYWIAVKPSIHNKGIGGALLAHAEERIAREGGRLIIAETSSRDDYAATRGFYLRHRYEELARVRAYYRPGDDLVMYGKYLSPSGGT